MKRYNLRKIALGTLPVLMIGIGVVAFGMIAQNGPAKAVEYPLAQRCLVTTAMGHRGTASRGVKQNSLAAFQLAAAQGVKVLEFDIHRTKDGQWVVYHDAKIKGRSIKKNTYKTLRKYDSQLATYRQVMAFISTQPGVRALPEIKPNKVSKKSLKYIARVINQYGMKNRTEIQSFHRKVLTKWRKYNKGYQLAFIQNKVKYKPATIRKFANSVIVHKKLVYNGKVSINAMHRAGLKVYVYTANNQAEWGALIVKGADAILTDYASSYQQWCQNLQPQPEPPVYPPTPDPVVPPLDPPTPTDPVDPPDPTDPVDPSTSVSIND